YRCRRRYDAESGAVRKARAGGGGLSGARRPAGQPLHHGRLRQHPADRRQRQRRRQGAEPPHRFRGEMIMATVAQFFWGWLVASLLLGFAMGWISVVQRGDGVTGAWGRALWALVGVLASLAVGDIIPGRFGYWLDLGLVMFVLYLVGCVIG